jgi:hypothetical protein
MMKTVRKEEEAVSAEREMTTTSKENVISAREAVTT